jgi:hypothetical protein
MGWIQALAVGENIHKSVGASHQEIERLIDSRKVAKQNKNYDTVLMHKLFGKRPL